MSDNLKTESSNSCWLSICVPTFNRKRELSRLLGSIPRSLKDVELVVIDDGSTDGTESLIHDFASLSQMRITYHWQENAGRAHALYNAAQRASGKYTVIMDSDDWFTPDAFHLIRNAVKKCETHSSAASLAGVVFNTATPSGTLNGTEFPSEFLLANLLSVRADHGVRGDKKEVVRTNILRSALYEPAPTERRVPTSLFWARIADEHDCLFVNQVVAIKEYLAGGLSANIRRHKLQNPRPMAELFRIRSLSPRYRSRRFRFVSQVNFLRYSFHSGRATAPTWRHLFALLPATVLYVSDLASSR